MGQLQAQRAGINEPHKIALYDSSVDVSERVPAGDFARGGRETLARPAELTLVQLALVSDVLIGAQAEFGAVGGLQARPAVVAESFTRS